MSLEEQVVTALSAQGAWLISVESCTGGLISHRITNIAGSSASYWGSLIVYENSAKTKLAHVPESLLKTHGAVSPQTAQALAEGGLAQLKLHSPGIRAHYAVATTGIAGPSGGSAEKPVGLCYIAVASSLGESRVEKIQAPLQFDRLQTKTFFSDQALGLLLKTLSGATAYA